MCLVVCDSLLVVDAAVQGEVDAEGQESHAASLSRTRLAMERHAVVARAAVTIRAAFNLPRSRLPVGLRETLLTNPP
jgi:hypothetical protein